MNDTGPNDTASTIAEIEKQERDALFSRFTNDDAWTLGNILVDLARSRSLAVTIDITRGEQQLFHAALPGTSAHNDSWITRKTRTVREFGISSYLAGLRARLSGYNFEDAPWIDSLKYAGHGGSFPITVTGVGVVGTVTVSGLLQREDHDLAVEAIMSFLSAKPTDL